jgi:hypothetical protein
MEYKNLSFLFTGIMVLKEKQNFPAEVTMWTAPFFSVEPKQLHCEIFNLENYEP